MDWLARLVNIVLHLNLYIGQLAGSYGPWIYVLLFLIIFSETGLVVTPFLPGDALLFAVGALTTADGPLNLPMILFLLTAAGILGHTTNYWIGNKIGKKLYSNPESRIFKQKHLQQTHAFYERYGAKTIMLSRFVPLIRTFAPFVAGMGSMSYGKFFAYNVIGAIGWVFGVVLMGHFFGNIPYVQKNFSLVIIAIIVVSMIPPTTEILRALRTPANRTSKPGRRQSSIAASTDDQEETANRRE
ncbi:MAG TPA: DedA family protein [Chthoniobacterales bacterium]|jgi:membrane-associated protein|nr:DedA family protein [Chthoniobacterales bacterium]